MKKHSRHDKGSVYWRMAVGLTLLIMYAWCQVTAEDGGGQGGGDGDNNGDGQGGGGGDDGDGQGGGNSSMAGNVCKNDTCAHGTCNDTSGTALCTCDSGWTGDNCTEDEDECTQQVCVHSDFCENRRGTYICYCQTGWEGQNCDEDVNECDGKNCTDEHASCRNNDGSYDCVCVENFERLVPDGPCLAKVILPYNNSKTKREWGDDKVFGVFHIPAGFELDGQPFVSYYISTNGYITFNDNFSHPTMPNISSPQLTSLSFVAPYWADIDIPQGSATSGLYHAELSLEETHTDNETKAVFEDYSSADFLSGFQPVFIGVVTWVDVLPYKAEDFPNFPAATFQVVMATDGWSMRGRVGWRTRWSGDENDFHVKAGFRLGKEYVDWSLPDTPITLNFTAGNSSADSVAPCVDWLSTEGQQFQDTGSNAVHCPCSQSQAETDPLFGEVNNSCANSQVFDYLTHGKQRCCYGSEDKMIETNPVEVEPPELKDAEKRKAVEKGMNACCNPVHPVLCIRFRRLFPLDTCSAYAPVSALVWGGGHVITVDGQEYTFNGWGEYVLLRSPDSAQNTGLDLQIQVRMEKTDQNATVFTALAVKYGNASSFEVQVSGDEVKVYVEGVEKAAEEVDVGDDVVLRQEGSVLNAHFPSGVSLKVTPVTNRLSAELSAGVVDPLRDSQGLLGMVDSNVNNDFSFRNGTTLNMNSQNLTSELVFQFGQSWALEELESLFVYNLSGDGKNFSDYQRPDFEPTFLPTTTEELLSLLNETDEMNEAKELCVENVACLQDFLTVGSEMAGQTNATQKEFLEMQEKLDKKPPQFLDPSAVWHVALTSLIFRQNVSVEPEVTNASVYPTVTVTSQPDDVPLNYTFEPSTEGTWEFVWHLEDSLMTLTSLTLTFKASSSVTGLIWEDSPAVVLCACEEQVQCDFSRVNQQLQAAAYMGLYMADCNCGEKNCKDDVNFCDACYDVTMCKASVEECQCPEGYEGNGVKCYEKDECLGGHGCAQECQNTAGSFTCSCRDGYTLFDQRRCQDKDECAAESHNCTVREFCENTEGFFLCHCRPGYGGNDCTKEVSHRYGGHLVMAEVPSKRQVWSDALQDPQSKQFKDLATVIQAVVGYRLTQKNIIFVEVTVIRFQLIQPARKRRSVNSDNDDMIQANFEVSTNQQEDVPSLQEAIMSGFPEECTGDMCSLSGDGDQTLYGVVKDSSGFEENYDLCASDRSNNCHNGSTICVTVNGTAQCQCRDGYKAWSLYDNVCQDKDECKENSTEALCHVDAANANNTKCENTDGSYYCICPHSYQWNADQRKCVEVILKDICSEDKPCRNDAECVNTMDNYGYACRCTDGWTGSDCDEEDAEAKRFKWILIGVACGLGVLCLFLLIALIVLCLMRTRRKKYERGSVYGMATPIPRPSVRHGDSPRDTQHQESMHKYTEFRRTDSDVGLATQPTNGASMQRYNNPVFTRDDEVVSKRM